MKKSLNFVSVIVAMVCVLSIVACSGGGGPKPTPPCTENCGPVVNDGSTMEKAIPVVIGTAKIRIKKEEVYYSVTLAPGESYKILVGAPAVTTLFDSAGNSLATSSDYEDGIIIWDCSSGGKYYFLVEPDNINRDYQILVIIADDPVIDSDDDGVIDSEDSCPGTPANESVDANGCSDSQIDSDDDGVVNSLDICPTTPAGESADVNGCSDSQKDSDGDGIVDSDDEYPNCDDRIDSDGDGISDCGDTVVNDGSSIEAAIELASGETITNLTGIKKYFIFSGVKGKYYDVKATFFNSNMYEQHTERRITIFNSSKKYLAVMPGVASDLEIYRWLCPENGTYNVTVDCPLEEIETYYSMKIEKYDTWIGLRERAFGVEEGDGHDRFEMDDKYWYGRSIAIDEVQNRTSLYPEGYDFDWVFALVEQGKTYEFRVINTLNADMAFSLYGPEGGDSIAYIPHLTTSFTWTALFTDFIFMRLVSWNWGVYGEYSFQIAELQ